MKKGKRLAKNIGILSIGNFSSKILSFLLVPLYTNVLTTSEYGIYDLSYSIVQIIFPILTLNVVDGIMVFAMLEKKKSRGYFLLGLRMVITSWLFVAVLFSIAVFGIGLFPSLRAYTGYIVLFYGVYSLNQLMLQYVKALDRTKDIAISGILASIVMLCGNLWFLLIVKRGLAGFFLANIMGLGVSVVYYLIVISQNKAENDVLKQEDVKSLVRYSIPLIVVSLSWWINSSLDKYVVAVLCGISATGLLAISYKIPSMINIVQTIFMQAWHISGIEEYGTEGGNAFYDMIFRLYNASMCTVCTFLIFIAKYLALFLFSKDFYVAWEYTPFLIVSTVVNASAGFFGPILSAKKDSVTMAKSGIYGALTNGVLNFILVYFIGIQGAVIATLISSAVIYVVRAVNVKKMIRVESFKMIYLSWLLLLVQAVAILINGSILIQAAVLLAVFCIYRKEYLMVTRKVLDSDAVKALLPYFVGGSDGREEYNQNRTPENCNKGGVDRQD